MFFSMYDAQRKRETKSYQTEEDCLRIVCFFPLHRFKDLDCVATVAKCWQTKRRTEEKREGKERGRRAAAEKLHGCPDNHHAIFCPSEFFQRNDGQGVCYSSHSPSNPYSSLPLSLPSNPSFLLARAPRSTSSSVLRPGLLEAAVVALWPVGNGGSSKHTSCPSGEALMAKDTMNHFSHT